MSYITILGCGNIGFRHLQAILAMSDLSAMHLAIVEPNRAHHPRIAGEVEGQPLASVEILDALPQEGPVIDLAIIATNADIRKRVLDGLLGTRDVRAMILEKVLFQRIADLEDAASKLAAAGTRAYVNCGRRGFPGYQILRAELGESGPVHLTVTGANFALASNGIHFLDLAEFLNDAPLESLDGSGLTSGTMSSKRDGFIEVTGTLTGQLANGGTISVTCDQGEAFALDIRLETAQGPMIIDELGGSLTRADGTTAGFETRHVSGMPELYETALTGTNCALTPYDASAGQHRLFLAALLVHLGAAPDDLCPIS